MHRFLSGFAFAAAVGVHAQQKVDWFGTCSLSGDIDEFCGGAETRGDTFNCLWDALGKFHFRTVLVTATMLNMRV